MKEIEPTGQVTLFYNCLGCDIFKGRTVVEKKNQYDVIEKISAVWVEHNKEMHNGKGDLSIKFEKE